MLQWVTAWGPGRHCCDSLGSHTRERLKARAVVLVGLTLATLRLFPLLKPPPSCSRTPGHPHVSALAAAHPSAFRWKRAGCGVESGSSSPACPLTRHVTLGKPLGSCRAGDTSGCAGCKGASPLCPPTLPAGGRLSSGSLQSIRAVQEMGRPGGLEICHRVRRESHMSLRARCLGL